MSTSCDKCGSNLETSSIEYYKAVRSIVEEIKEAVISGELTEEEVYDRVHEEIDGSWWVIYTHAAIAVVTHSDSDGAYLEEYGSEGLVEGGTLNWSRLAYAAMEADVNEDINVAEWIEERDAKAEDADVAEARP